MSKTNTRSERDKFEAYCRRSRFSTVPADKGSGYRDPATQRAWLAWQYRAKLEIEA